MLLAEEELSADTMREFQEWAIRIAVHGYNTDLVMPISIGNETEFVFSTEAYNEFVRETGKGRELDHDGLELLLERRKKELYKGEVPIRHGDRFFLLPGHCLHGSR